MLPVVAVTIRLPPSPPRNEEPAAALPPLKVRARSLSAAEAKGERRRSEGQGAAVAAAITGRGVCAGKVECPEWSGDEVGKNNIAPRIIDLERTETIARLEATAGTDVAEIAAEIEAGSENGEGVAAGDRMLETVHERDHQLTAESDRAIDIEEAWDRLPWVRPPSWKLRFEAASNETLPVTAKPPTPRAGRSRALLVIAAVVFPMPVRSPPWTCSPVLDLDVAALQIDVQRAGGLGITTVESEGAALHVNRSGVIKDNVAADGERRAAGVAGKGAGVVEGAAATAVSKKPSEPVLPWARRVPLLLKTAPLRKSSSAKLLMVALEPTALLRVRVLRKTWALSIRRPPIGISHPSATHRPAPPGEEAAGRDTPGTTQGAVGQGNGGGGGRPVEIGGAAIDQKIRDRAAQKIDRAAAELGDPGAGRTGTGGEDRSRLGIAAWRRRKC